MQQLAQALLAFLARNPSVYTDAADSIRATLACFITAYLEPAPPNWRQRLEHDSGQGGAELVRTLLAQPPAEIFGSRPSVGRVIADVADVVQRLGMRGIWLTLDKLDSSHGPGWDAWSQLVEPIVATKELFEIEGFVVKIFAPSSRKARLLSCEAVTSKRLDVFHLQWNERQLRAIVEQRLAVGFGLPAFPLANLSTDRDFTKWVADYGGQVPQGWLELVRPLVVGFDGHSAWRPLNADERARCVSAMRPC